MRIENGLINLSSSHDLKASSEVKVETHIHNRIETHDGDVYESERTLKGEIFDIVSLSGAEMSTEERRAIAEQGIRVSGQGISISTRDSFHSGSQPADEADGNSQISEIVKKHYSRMDVEATEFSKVSLNRSTGMAAVRDLQAEFLIRIMEMGVGRFLKEMSSEELGKMGLSEDNIMRIRDYFNGQDVRRAQQQADINQLKGRQVESDVMPDRNRARALASDRADITNPSQATTQASNADNTRTPAHVVSGIDTTGETAPTASAQQNSVASDNEAVMSAGSERAVETPEGQTAISEVAESLASTAQVSAPQADESDSRAAMTATTVTTSAAADQSENSEEEEPIPEGMVRLTTTLTESRESIFREEEHTRFSAQGKVLTSDGREIDIELDVGMSRKFEATELAQSIKVLKDPLVVNFDGPAVALDDHRTFMFDIDMDGEKDQLAQLKAGSGFLALDKNGDGIINDGSELFGAQSGNGFADLAEYDEDGDGFIDEDDAVFNQLRIWVPGDKGESELFALLDKDIGAIHLNHVDTEFALNRITDNENLGYVRSSGVFLKESGGVGSVQQIDLAI